MRLIEITNPEPPETPWHELTTGKPAMFYAYRGVGSTARSFLTPEWQARFGRQHLLGDGIYVAPTKTIASNFGAVQTVKVVLYNPYVIERAYGATDLLQLPLQAIRKTHDGIVIKEGRAVGNEDLKQAVIFPEHADQVQFDIEKPTFTTLQKGAKVRITHVPPVQLKFHPELADAVGKTGRVASIAVGGHPSVRLKGKTYLFSKQDVEVVS